MTICLAAETYVLQEAHACLLLASCGPARNVGLQPCWGGRESVLSLVRRSQGLGPYGAFHLRGASGGVELSSGERTQLVQTLQCGVWSAVRVLLWTLARDVCGGPPVRKNGEAGSPCSDVQWRQRVPRACPAGLCFQLQARLALMVTVGMSEVDLGEQGGPRGTVLVPALQQAASGAARPRLGPA